MSKPFTHLAALVLFVVGVAHAVRLYAALSVAVGGYMIPLWMSWPAAGVALSLAVMLLVEARKR